MIWLLLAIAAAAIALWLHEAAEVRAAERERDRERDRWRERVRERVRERQRRPGETFIEWRMRVDTAEGDGAADGAVDADADAVENGVVMHWPQGRPEKGKVQ
jgi:hypothetical protein